MNTTAGLYQKVLLEHHKNPLGFHNKIAITHSATGANVVCGDEITIEDNITAGKVQELAFLGDSCAICRASASMMCQHLLHQPLSQIANLIKVPMDLIKGEYTAAVNSAECFSSLAVIKQYPVRMQCALLPWQTFISAINNKNEQRG